MHKNLTYRNLTVFLILFVITSCGGSSSEQQKSTIQEPSPAVSTQNPLPIIDLENKIEQISVFIELANQVRFFHPSDGAADTTWEKFIAYGIYRVANTADQAEFVTALQELFATIAPSLKINGQAAVEIEPFRDNEQVQVYSARAYIDAIELPSSAYRRTLKKEAYSKLRGYGFIVNASHQQSLALGIEIDLPLVQSIIDGQTTPTSARLSAEFDNYDIDIQFSNLYARLNAAGKLWSVIQFFYPYLDELDLVWHDELTPLLDQCLESEDSCILAMKKLLTKTGDNHNTLYSASTALKNYTPPLGFAWLENKAILVYKTDANVTETIGDQLVAIDGIDIETLLLEQKAYSLRADNKKYSRLVTIELLKGLEGNAVELTLRKNNGSEYLVSTSRTESLWDVYTQTVLTMTGASTGNDSPKHLVLGNQIHYVNVSALESEDVEATLEKIAEAKAVVLDLRNYPSWFGWTKFLPHFANYPITTLPFYDFSYHSPDQQTRSERQILQSFDNKEPFIDVPVIVLSSRYSISQNEHALGYVQSAGLPILGEVTYGINGTAAKLYLLGGNDNGGITVIFTGQKVTQHDGSLLRGVGLIPDIEVPLTIDSIVNGEDIQLQKAVEYLQQQLN